MPRHVVKYISLHTTDGGGGHPECNRHSQKVGTCSETCAARIIEKIFGGGRTVAASGQYNVLEYTLLRYLIPPMQSCLSLCAAWNVVSLHT